MKKTIPFLCALVLIAALFVSCERDDNKNHDFGEYILSGDESSAGPAAPEGALTPDYSWMTSYALKYTYFDGSETSEITEGKSANYYRAEDAGSNSVVYIERKDGYLLEYMLNPADYTGAVSVVTDSDIADLHSGFMMLSAADSNFPLYTNVTPVGPEPVAGRRAMKYVQNGEPASGENGRTAYVWIDDEYGFASKCELYDSVTQELLMKWELESFALNVQDSDVVIDLSGFDIASQ